MGDTDPDRRAFSFPANPRRLTMATATKNKPRQIREHMDVIASCGTRVGVVDRIEENSIKLTRADSPDGLHHYIPADWVERVDDHVRLRKNSMEVQQNWKPDAASCGCGG
jgi:hypothetical protein